VTARDSREANQSWWDRHGDDYQRSHGDALARELLAWGVWRVPEAEVGALGDVEGKDVLEYGCGGAQWAVGLAQRGARVVGLDVSSAQLAHAQRLIAASGVDVGLLMADGAQVPLADASFDIVFSDHGATTFCPPQRTVAEAARLLRPGGLLAFCIGSPLRDLCDDGEEVTGRLRRSYFEDLGRMSYREITGEELVWYQLPYGEWIRLFRRHGFRIEDLIELRPPAGAQTTYSDFVTPEWARQWPAECLWRLVREPEVPP
jgi:SAM-dependent methyltransferase